MQSRRPKAEELEFLNYSAQIPCLACSLFHESDDSPAEFHHIKGKNVPDAHLFGFSLCVKHHRVPDHEPKRWISRHGDGRQAFEDRYQSEFMFLEEQRKRVETLKKSFVGEGL